MSFLDVIHFITSAIFFIIMVGVFIFVVPMFFKEIFDKDKK